MVLGKKNFLVLGFTERTGFNVAKFLLENGCKVFISDKVRDENKIKLLEELKKLGDAVDLLGTEELPSDNVEMVIASPGVPLFNPVIRESKRRGIEVIGDIELFYRLNPHVKYIAITGTDGKTTTTKLTYHVLSKYLKNVGIGGNVGIPIFSINSQNVDYLVLEISSFQIDTTVLFNPFIGAITNIAKDHLDRYSSFDEYVDSKFSLFKNHSPNDYAILNSKLRDLKQVNRVPSKKIFFSATLNSDVSLENGFITFLGEKIIDVSKVKLIGKHNVENIMIAVSVARILGVPNEVIEEAVYSFSPLPHRMELVLELDGVKYINDSKATTINAMVSGIMSIEGDIILIAGGLDKGMDFSEAVPAIKERVKYVITIGSTGPRIVDELRKSGYENCVFVNSLEEAVKLAREKAARGTSVLFSPGYASFDMFKNYEERGEKFKEIVKSL
jgi:UDP-N-acetylmuramoylalanine--D-glutamate ligase